EEIGEVFDKWNESQKKKPIKRQGLDEIEGATRGQRVSSWTENVLASWSEFDRVIAQELKALMEDNDSTMDKSPPSGGSSPNFTSQGHLQDDEADSGLERSAEVLDQASTIYYDCGAQTSPAVSRSSSFTWLSDSSSLPEEEGTDTSSSSSPQPDSSGDSHKEENPSPPPATATTPKSCQKCRRKETWERLRRRQSTKDQTQNRGVAEEIWVRRQSQTIAESSSEPDLMVNRIGNVNVAATTGVTPAIRPTTLRFGPPSSCSGSSVPSPSSECGSAAGESPQQELSSSKSSSAPLLHQNRFSSLPSSRVRNF
ncbi:unnamed protein product, partial [Nesidiocoris tenuis]